jgi:pimeloyl-ACP methyl ester carboxylesterase
MGGGVALQVAIRHPEVVRKLVVASASYTSDGMHPELLEMIPKFDNGVGDLIYVSDLASASP